MLLRFLLASSMPMGKDEFLVMVRACGTHQFINHLAARLLLHKLLQHRLAILQGTALPHHAELPIKLAQHIITGGLPALVKINRANDRLKGILQIGSTGTSSALGLSMPQEQAVPQSKGFRQFR